LVKLQKRPGHIPLLVTTARSPRYEVSQALAAG
jgi:hypothetical protein